MKRSMVMGKDDKDNMVRAIVFTLLVGIIVAFGYWCHVIKEYRDNTNLGAPLAAAEYREMAFEGAVVGFLLIYAVVHIYKELY